LTAFSAVFVMDAILARDTGGLESYRDDSYQHNTHTLSCGQSSANKK